MASHPPPHFAAGLSGFGVQPLGLEWKVCGTLHFFGGTLCLSLVAYWQRRKVSPWSREVWPLSPSLRGGSPLNILPDKTISVCLGSWATLGGLCQQCDLG